jgi:hypothetical protein
VGQKLKAFDVELIRGEHGSGSGGFGWKKAKPKITM